ncbi:MAG: glucosamine-6-phosphate deaminase [Planctomycetota bacterium]
MRLPTKRRAIVKIFADTDQSDHHLATEIATLIRERRADDRSCILGLATGSTPLGVYGELIRMHREEALSFANVVSFNLDEYFPMAPDHAQSYVRFMNERLFDHVDIPRENTHIPDGSIALNTVENFCRDYEERISRAGGIDLQILGIGRTGHIGFNEPGSSRQSRTRMVQLNDVTRNDAAEGFHGKENVPSLAITMGVQTIFEARRVRLLASGRHKAAIIQRAVEGAPCDEVPATLLKGHGDFKVLLDRSAASQLSSTDFPSKNS